MRLAFITAYSTSFISQYRPKSLSIGLSPLNSLRNESHDFYDLENNFLEGQEIN